MASNRFESLYKCVACDNELSRLSKCLPCLHSVCQSCFLNTFDVAKTNCTCPKCHVQFVDWKDFAVSPIIAKELMQQEFASLSEFQCNWCSEDGIPSVAKFWCEECRIFFCDYCSRKHKKLLNTHISKDLDEMRKSEAIALMMKMQNDCPLHRKELEIYCRQCGNCYCNKCFATHANNPMSLCTNVTPLSVCEEILKRTEQFPNIRRKMVSFEDDVKALTENVLRFVREFKSDCARKRSQVWLEYESIVNKAKQDAVRMNEKIDDEMQEMLAKCHRMMRRNDEIVQEISTWLPNVDHLLSEGRQDVEVLSGMLMLERQCPVSRHVLQPMEMKYEMLVEFPDYWRKTIDSLQYEDVGFVTVEKVENRKISKENRFDLPEAKKDRYISSIYVNEKEHIFVCDQNNKSLIEFKKNGEIRTELKFFHVTNDKSFQPLDICLISTESILVVCGCSGHKNLLFLKEKNNSPFFQLTNFVETKTNFVSLCEQNETIFVLDTNFKINSFSKKCNKLEIFQLELNDLIRLNPFYSRICQFLSRIRVDPLSGNIWFSNLFYPELICFDLNFKQINSMKKKRKFYDFHLNKLGQIFFCDLNENEICWFPNQTLVQFEEQQDDFLPIFVFENKYFVCVKKNGRIGIEIFKKFY